MKFYFFRNIGLLVFPFLVMFFFNKMYKPNSDGIKYNYSGVKAMNTSQKNPNHCSWACYLSTNYCRENHLKHLNGLTKYTDIPYNKIIHYLYSSGDYMLANIIVLVILIPTFIWFFIIKSLNIQSQINKIHKL